MMNVKLKTDSMALPEKEQFLISCSRTLEKIAEVAPSDSIMNMSIDFDGEEYILDLELVSGELRISAVGSAKSPFVALEKILMHSLERIRKWTATRKIEVA